MACIKYEAFAVMLHCPDHRRGMYNQATVMVVHKQHQ